MEGTFQYDLDENMIYDASKDLTIKYDNYNLPIEFVSEPMEGQAYKQFNLYDYNGQRVSSLSWGKVNIGGYIDTPPVNEEIENPEDYGDADPQWQYYGAKHYFTIDGRKRSEIIERPEEDAAEYVALQGIGSQIGRIRPDNTREYYLKNHQGSLLKSVDATGQDMYILDYMPYGSQTVHYAKDEDIPSKQYTGKEYDPFLALTYYGARYFDPVLAVWSVPDPAGQFSNPYYFGGDPLNYVDPDGEFVHIIVGAVVGAGVGIYKCSSGNTDNCAASIIGGAAIGAAVAGTGGAFAAGASGSAFAVGAGTGFVAGTMGGAMNYTLDTYTNDNMQWGMEGFTKSMAMGGGAGTVGGGVGAWTGSLAGGGAVSAVTGGGAGGVAGAAITGSRGEDLLWAGLMGAGIAFGGYTAQWTYDNYGGRHDISGLDRGEPVAVDESYSDEIFSPEAIEAKKMLVSRAKSEGVKLSELEVGANFKHRTTFLRGERYLKMSNFAVEDPTVTLPDGTRAGVKVSLSSKAEGVS